MKDNKLLPKQQGLTPAGKLKVDTGRPKSMAQRIAEQQAALRDERTGGPRHIISIDESEPVAILMDDSSSMSSHASFTDPNSNTKYGYMCEAVSAFANDVDFRVTPVKTSRFNNPTLKPAFDPTTLRVAADSARPSGGTPMDKSLQAVLESDIRRSIMISDGEANDKDKAIEIAKSLAERQKVVDCIHIGSDRGGEETMKEVAEITGGMFFKFTDVQSFAKNFKQLSPRGRKRLEKASAAELKLLMGASEVQK
jgi:hypothetical protein